ENDEGGGGAGRYAISVKLAAGPVKGCQSFRPEMRTIRPQEGSSCSATAMLPLVQLAIVPTMSAPFVIGGIGNSLIGWKLEVSKVRSARYPPPAESPLGAT